MAYEIGDSPVYVTKIDDTTSATYTYIGEAVPGTGTDASKWRVQRITNASGNIDWARGGSFNQIWDDRTSLVYG